MTTPLEADTTALIMMVIMWTLIDPAGRSIPAFRGEQEEWW